MQIMDMITREEMAVAYTISRGRASGLPDNANRVLGDARHLKAATSNSEKAFNRIMINAENSLKDKVAQLSKQVAAEPNKNIFYVTD